MFKILITFAFGCFMLGWLYEVVTLLVGGDISAVVHIGMLAVIGAFAFLFSASYGQMDGIVDDKCDKLRKYRFLAAIAPIIAGIVIILGGVATGIIIAKKRRK